MFEQNKKHGTLYGYNIDRCRCDKCKEVKRNIRKGTPVKKHGTKWGYDKGCRCDECKKAKASYWHKQHPNAKPPVTDIEKQLRKCSWCNEIKSLDEFPRNIREFLGRNYYCKPCHNKRSRENKNIPQSRFTTYQWGAKIRKLSFDLSLEEFMLFWNKPCYYCENEIDGIGLDRKDSSIGYNLNNIVPCCWRCNKSKSDQTTYQFIQMCLKISEKFKDYVVSSS